MFTYYYSRFEFYMCILVRLNVLAVQTCMFHILCICFTLYTFVAKQDNMCLHIFLCSHITIVALNYSCACRILHVDCNLSQNHTTNWPIMLSFNSSTMNTPIMQQ